MNTPNRNKIRLIIKSMRGGGILGKQSLLKYWPLRESMDIPYYNDDLPMGFDNESHFALWYALQDDL